MKRKSEISQKINKGRPSAALLSILIHAGIFLLAGMFVVFTVVKKEEYNFKPPMAVERPKMKLKKPKVKVKKSAKPKSSAKILTKVNRANMVNIELPGIGGIGDGLIGGQGGVGFGDMPDLTAMSVFGSSQSIGNDFVGAFYDLKRNREGRGIPMDESQYMQVVRNFCLRGWKERDLARYYRSPGKLYSTHFMVPPIVSPIACDVFGAPEAKSYYFLIKYKGELVYKEDIKFRFWGIGDAFICVRVGGELVLVNGWQVRLNILDFWQSSDHDSDKFYVANMRMKVGDWITLKAGEPVDMQVLFGEYKGGDLSAILLVEVDGVDYPKSRQGGPLLPAFKTEELSLDVQEEIVRYLPSGECTLTNGPVFRDF